MRTVAFVVCGSLLAGLLWGTDAILYDEGKDQQTVTAQYTQTGYWTSDNEYELNSQYSQNSDMTHVISPGANQDASLNQRCDVTITYDADIELSLNCAYDRLILNYGQSDSRTVCGRWEHQKYTTSVRNKEVVVLKFISDSWVQKTGFRLGYIVKCYVYATTIPAITTFSSVDGATDIAGRTMSGIPGSRTVISANRGWFQSPNFPNDYDGGLNEVYQAILKGSRVHITYFCDMEYQETCVFDYLKISTADGDRRLCGRNQTGEMDITVNNNKLELLFHSDRSFNYKGFKLTFTVTDYSRKPRSALLSIDSAQTGGNPSISQPHIKHLSTESSQRLNLAVPRSVRSSSHEKNPEATDIPFSYGESLPVANVPASYSENEPSTDTLVSYDKSLPTTSIPDSYNQIHRLNLFLPSNKNLATTVAPFSYDQIKGIKIFFPNNQLQSKAPPFPYDHRVAATDKPVPYNQINSIKVILPNNQNLPASVPIPYNQITASPFPDNPNFMKTTANPFVYDKINGITVFLPNAQRLTPTPVPLHYDQINDIKVFLPYDQKIPNAKIPVPYDQIKSIKIFFPDYQRKNY